MTLDGDDVVYGKAFPSTPNWCNGPCIEGSWNQLCAADVFYWRYVWPVDIYRDFFSAKLLLRDLWMRCSQSTMWMVDTCHFRLTANLPKLVTGLIWLDSSRVSSNEEFFHKVPATVEYAASTNGTKQSTLKVLFFTCLIQTLETLSSCDKNMHFFLDVQRLGWPFQNMLWGNPYLFFCCSFVRFL